MKNHYSIETAIDTCAEGLAAGSDHSATTIRCCINDILDGAGKDGFSVRHDYNQERAIRKVKKRISEINTTKGTK